MNLYFFIFNSFIIVGTVAPLAGFLVLLKKTPTRASVSLMLANLGALVMNSGYALISVSDTRNEALYALKIQFVGNGIFLIFFAIFIIYYLHFRHEVVFTFAMAIGEITNLFFTLTNLDNGYIIRNTKYGYKAKFGVYSLVYEPGLIHDVKYWFLTVVVYLIVLQCIIRIAINNNKTERKNTRRLIASLLIIATTWLLKLVFRFSFDLTPVALSVALLIIDFGVIQGDFLRVTDLGREWMFDNMDQAFVIVDGMYGLLDCNRGAMRIFPELRHVKMERKIPNEVRELFDLKTGSEATIGSKTYELVIRDIIQYDAIMGHCLVLHDDTEHIKLMNHLKEQKRLADEAKERADAANKAKSSFVSTISHEIRTPMNAIVGITDIMLRDNPTGKNYEYLMNIKSSGAALLMIINDILDYSKIEAGAMHIVEGKYTPVQMLNDMHMIFVTRIGSKPVELKYDIMNDLPGKLWGDSVRIKQIIINFMNNAIKFTESGSVTLSVKSIKEGPSVITLEFSITDTGMGIKESDKEKLFKSFSQVDEKKNHSKEGTGLGLTICKQLAEQMGGSVGVESEYGKGSTFFFRIPQRILEREPVSEVEMSFDENVSLSCKDVKLLLVDDNKMNLKVAEGLLEPLGMEITTASNGKEAIEEVKSKKYDIVFMDHMMPIMDGVEATERIRKLDDEYFKQLPIVALTANVTEEARKEYTECGMNAFLSKPIKMSEVMRNLENLLPKEKIEYADGKDGNSAGMMKVEDLEIMKYISGSEVIDGINVKAGIENCGTTELFHSLLGDFYKYIDSKANKINKCLEDGMIRDYTIEVHALKNTSRMIGALELSKEFENLEKLGNAEDVQKIKELNDGVIEHLLSYKSVLEKYSKAQNENLKEVSKDKIAEVLEGIKSSMDSFDLDGADAMLSKLEEYKLPCEIIEMVNELSALVADVAIEDTISKCDEILSKLATVDR